MSDLGDDGGAGAPGDLFGPFRLHELLGAGGMGVVHRAESPEGRMVALKMLRPGLLSPALLARFARETEVLRRLDHPGIARFVDAGVAETARGPVPWLATELIEGRTLREWAREEHPVPVALELLARLAEAAHSAHETGVVHRDLKPENVMVDAAGAPHLLDFGVARLRDADIAGGTMTVPGLVVGSIRYMSPEQAEAQPGTIDARTDVYALGVIGCELLSGRLPYEVPEDSLHRALVAVLTSEPIVLETLTPPLRAVLERALRKRPDERYPSAAALASELRRCAAGLEPTALREQRQRDAARRGGRLGRAVAVGTLLLASLGVAWWALRRAESPRAREVSANPDRAIAYDCALLDSIDTRLHDTVRTRLRIEEALVMLGLVKTDLARFPARPYVADLRRYAFWREGEARFFLGERYGLPDQLDRAADAWLQAPDDSRPPGSRARLPDTSIALYERILSMRHEQAEGAAGMAYGVLARYRQPVPLLQKALRLQRGSMYEVIARDCRGTDSLSAVPVRDPDLYCEALNSMGGDYSDLGAAIRDTPILHDGLRFLVRADSIGAMRALHEADASLQYNLGNTYMRIGRWERQPAAFDSAEVRLRRSLETREALRDNVTRLDSRLALAETWRWRARAEGIPARARAWLAAADTLLAGAERPGYVEMAESQRARIQMARAAVVIDRASLDHEVFRLGSADSLIARALPALPRPSMPLLFAMAVFERGRAAATRGLITATAGRIDDALLDMDLATNSVSWQEAQGFRKTVRDVGARLKQATGERVSLEYPMRWGD